jgi:hydroxymethylglutaryl-CoA reductase (NADPH)
MNAIASIPMQTVGPIKMIGDIDAEVCVPLATYETPLWPSVNRGAKMSRLCGGISVTLLDERMTRSIVFDAPNAARARAVVQSLNDRYSDLQQVISANSRHTTLLMINHQIIGRLLYLRLEFSTGDASGHNMVTQAADHIMGWMLTQYADLRDISVSGNYCTDKKVSAVNGILGRGKNVVAEMRISNEMCEKHLRTTPALLAELNVKKNLIGSIAAGSLRSANAHFANMLLGVYLATGQDAANIVEGSQGITHVEAQETGVYFSVTLPNIIVGTVGAGKKLAFVKENLALLGCSDESDGAQNAKRLALIVAGTVFCGELSLLAAQTNRGELMRCHRAMEREKK